MVANRRMVHAEHGHLRVEQHFRLGSEEIGTDASGPAVVYAEVRVEKGRVGYLTGANVVDAPRRFAILIPPRCIVRARLRSCEVRVSAIAFRPAPGAAFPATPLLLNPFAEDAHIENLNDLLSRAAQRVVIGEPLDATRVTREAKAILDAEYARPGLRIAGIAERLHTSPAALSRSFRKSYGIPPVRYRHYLRVMEALLQFAEGATPLDAAQDAGFDDLGRFYRIFKDVACDSPGAYRPARSKNAKTERD